MKDSIWWMYPGIMADSNKYRRVISYSIFSKNFDIVVCGNWSWLASDSLRQWRSTAAVGRTLLLIYLFDFLQLPLADPVHSFLFTLNYSGTKQKLVYLANASRIKVLVHRFLVAVQLVEDVFPDDTALTENVRWGENGKWTRRQPLAFDH